MALKEGSQPIFVKQEEDGEGGAEPRSHQDSDEEANIFPKIPLYPDQERRDERAKSYEEKVEPKMPIAARGIWMRRQRP
jgi:hypothetical protein